MQFTFIRKTTISHFSVTMSDEPSALKNLDKDQVFTALSCMFINFRDNTPLAMLHHFGFDPWMPNNLLADRALAGQHALEHARHSIKQFRAQFPSCKLPVALNRSVFTETTFRRYATMLAFSLTYGTFVTFKVCPDQAKCNRMFDIDLRQRTDTRRIIQEYVSNCFVNQFPNASLNAFNNVLEQNRHGDDNLFVERLNEKVYGLNSPVKNQEIVTWNVDLFAALPKVVYPDSLYPDQQEEKDEVLTSAQTEGSEHPTESHDNSDDSDVEKDGDKVTGFKQYIPTPNQLFNKIQPSFDMLDSSISINKLLCYVRDTLTVCRIQVVSNTLGVGADACTPKTRQDYRDLIVLIDKLAIRAFYAILQKAPVNSHQFYLQQAKYVFHRYNILPSFANTYIAERMNSQVITFPFSEDYNIFDGIVETQITLLPPPVKSVSPVQRLNFNTDAKFLSPTQNTELTVPQSAVYGVPINANTQLTSVSHTPVHNVSKLGFPFLLSGGQKPTKSYSRTQIRGNSHSILHNGMQFSTHKKPTRVPSSSTKTQIPFLNTTFNPNGFTFDKSNMSNGPVQQSPISLGDLSFQSHVNLMRTSVTPAKSVANTVDDVRKLLDSQKAQFEQQLFLQQQQHQKTLHKLATENATAFKNLTDQISKLSGSKDVTVSTVKIDNTSQNASKSSKTDKTDNLKPSLVKSSKQVKKPDGNPGDGDDGDDSDDPDDDLSGLTPSQRRKLKKERKRKELLEELEMKTILTERVKSRVKITIENIKNNFTSLFYGYPSSSNKKKAIADTSDKAINFIIDVIRWIVVYVQPEQQSFPEEMAIKFATTKLRDQAHDSFQLYQTNVEKVETLNDFLLYMLLDFIKVDRLQKLKTAVLAGMPSDLDLHRSLSRCFEAHKLQCGVYLEIITLCLQKTLISKDVWNDLIISDKEIFQYRWKFICAKGFDQKFRTELSEHPKNIKEPENVIDMNKAMKLLEIIYNERKQKQAEIDAQNITFHQRDHYTDPTATNSAKIGASVNFTQQNFRQKGKRKHHSFQECNNPKRCRYHRNDFRKQQQQNGKTFQSQKSNNYGNQSQQYGNRNRSNNYSNNYNNNGGYQNLNQNREQKRWNSDTVAQRYNKHKGNKQFKKRKQGQRRNQRFQNVQRGNNNRNNNNNNNRYNKNNYGKNKNYNRNYYNNNDHNSDQHQQQLNDGSNANQQQVNHQNLNNINQKQHQHQRKKKGYKLKKKNKNNQFNGNFNNNNNNGNQNTNNYHANAFPINAKLVNSDIESDSSDPDSLYFAAPVTVNSIANN